MQRVRDLGANRTRIGRRIVVIGSTGSGKTTLAATLATRLGCPHIELDALHWGADWTEAPTDLFRDRVRHAVRGDTWVVDGNYSQARDLVWSRADTIVWLDYSLALILLRLTRRTWARLVKHTELWAGNRERWSSVFSRDSLLVWAVTTYRRRRHEYAALLLSQPRLKNVTVVHLRSPRATARWLATVRT